MTLDDYEELFSAGDIICDRCRFPPYKCSCCAVSNIVGEAEEDYKELLNTEVQKGNKMTTEISKLFDEASWKFQNVVKLLRDQKLTITAMESCTGGLIASLITDVNYSSEVFKGAFITYSNEAKIKQGVSESIIDINGVYSDETAVDMACVCRNTYNADIGIGVTGTLGRADPENNDSECGHVHIGISRKWGAGAIEILVSPDDKRKGKLVIANAVADILLEKLSNKGEE